MITDDHMEAMATARSRRIAIALFIGLFCILFALPLLYIPWRRNHREQMRARDLPITIKNAEPIIMAIKRYEKEKGKPPPSLESLIPYYIERIPDAGPVAKNGWHYQTDEDTTKQKAGATVSVDKIAEGWALFVWVRDEFSPNVWGFGDVFVYHPSGKYANQDYGGGLVPFRNWGYYIE